MGVLFSAATKMMVGDARRRVEIVVYDTEHALGGLQSNVTVFHDETATLKISQIYGRFFLPNNERKNGAFLEPVDSVKSGSGLANVYAETLTVLAAKGGRGSGEGGVTLTAIIRKPDDALRIKLLFLEKRNGRLGSEGVAELKSLLDAGVPRRFHVRVGGLLFGVEEKKPAFKAG